MKRDLLFDLSSVLSRTALCYVFSVFLALGKPMDTAMAAWTAGLMLCAAMFFYILRRTVKNAVLFIAANAAAAVLAFFIIPEGFRFGFTAGFVFFLPDSFYCRLRRSGTGEYAIHWAPAVFLCVLYIVGAGYHMQQFTVVCFYGEACFLACYFLQTGLLRTNRFLEDNKDIANVPYHKIRSQAGTVLFAFSALILAVMAVAPKTVLMRVMITVQNGILFVIKKFLGMIDVGKPSEIQEAKQIDLGGVFNNGIFEKSGEISPIWDILDNIVFILVYAAVFVGGVALIVFVYGRIKALFYKPLDSGVDVTERIVPDKVERIKMRRGKRSQKFAGPAENVKMRKLYKRYVQSAIPNVEKSATPGEISRAAAYAATNATVGAAPFAVKNTANAAEIQPLYEKARYSGTACSKEDTEKIKNLIKENK